ncbi:leucine--tRNA ligase [Chitinophagaceae bacterium MMS25-I14]
MEYNFRDIEQKWKKYWSEQQVYKVQNDPSRPKFYILDMFPYPSGAGLHVGHPLGYIASDIYARYKRLRGYNVLHPMGFDAFGLPAEQYALETGQHPAVTTENNIARYKEQLDNIGFCYDWSREFRTSDPSYYKWTQWIFLQLFESWYDRSMSAARPIKELVAVFEKEGNKHHPCPGDESVSFDSKAWNGFTEKEKHDILMQYRLAYCGFGEVNWCEGLGTVLANDEVVNGVSERGGFPVVKKKLRQWYLRITEYAGRLLESLETLDWTEAMKEMQRNWIGKSQGAEVRFALENSSSFIDVFTTRPDTIFGVDFMVLAPEHELVDQITTAAQKEAVEKYKEYVQSRSERERMSEVKQVTGCFTGAYAIHPFTRRQVPVWISEYVLAGYGTGAIMAVPSGDDRDFAFARHFEIPVTNIFGDQFTGEAAYSEKTGTLTNSDFLTGLEISKATDAAIRAIEDAGIGKRRINYRLRDAAFSRQRYWGEPFPIQWKEGMAIPLSEDQLPLVLPAVDKYTPGPEGEGPLANLPEWSAQHLETNTMPGYAGSSWYFLRYMDPHNETEFAGRAATDYWNQVDVYVGGTEHAVGHLLYSRMWTKALHDLGYISFDEPFKKLVNQGMIQGNSRFVYRVQGENKFVSFGRKDQYKTDEIHVDVNIVDGVELDIDAFRKWRPEYADAELILEDGKYICGVEIEKMSKRWFNVVNPDDIVSKFGADTFRMYEMFLGPIEQSKPWDTKGIEGVHRFLKKLWRLYADEQKGWIVEETPATDAELRIIHKTIKKISEDIERFSFNTCISQFMICVNELTAINCHKRDVLEALAVLLAPFAPHAAEELWKDCFKHESSVTQAIFPKYEEQYVTDNSKKYPVAVNGKTRTEMEFPLDIDQASLEKEVLADEQVIKWLEGKTPKKVIYVKGRMINVVV